MLFTNPIYEYLAADLIAFKYRLLLYVSYGVDDRDSIPGKSREGSFCLQHGVQTGSGAHPASYKMGTGILLWIKAAGS
jgi:hypothetical protein